VLVYKERKLELSEVTHSTHKTQTNPALMESFIAFAHRVCFCKDNQAVRLHTERGSI
jgi:hypothetical protein